VSLGAFLQSEAARLEDYGGAATARDYGDVRAEWEALDVGAALMDTSYRRSIVATGSERSDFLHGQLSADVRGITPGGGAGALLLTAQGRVVSLLALYDDRAGERIVLTVEGSWLEVTMARLEQFLVADDVEFEAAEPRDRITVAGPKAPALLAEVGIDGIPVTSAWLVAGGEIAGARVTVLGRGDLRVPAVELVVDGDASAVWTALERHGARAAGTAAYEIVRVESGTARYGVDVDEDRIATEARLEWCIHFAKGCYVGQEIVERSVSRGKLNRELSLLALEGTVASGDRVAGGNERDVVTSVVESPRLGALALAYVDKQASAAGTALTIDTATGPVAAKVLEWPRPRVLAGM
jgi:folate-binding protein YgfZ